MANRIIESSARGANGNGATKTAERLDAKLIAAVESSTAKRTVAKLIDAAKSVKKEQAERITITRPNFKTAAFLIRGESPYVQHKFGAKAIEMMRAKQCEGSTGTKGRKKEPKDFERQYQDSMHRSVDGWYGLPASGFRNACVSACKLVGYHMTKAKLALFIPADGYDKDGTPLVRITKGEPRKHECPVRLETGVADIRARGMWSPGWEATVKVRFDADMFTVTDVANLLMRVGMQVGVGEGRPDSKSSCGCGWGTFDVVQE